MDIFIGILTAVEVIVCLLLILVVLMQRPRQEGLGASFGDAAASQVWGAQTTNVLQKFTVYLAITLFALTILLAVLVSRHQTGGKSAKIFGDAKPEAAAPVAAPSDEEQAKAKIMEKIQEAIKKEAPEAGEPAKPAETPKAEEKKDAPAAPAPEKTEPAKTPDAPAAAPAPAPAPADQPK
jgi:preprotein translocase subunit SecG